MEGHKPIGISFDLETQFTKEPLSFIRDEKSALGLNLWAWSDSVCFSAPVSIEFHLMHMNVVKSNVQTELKYRLAYENSGSYFRRTVQ